MLLLGAFVVLGWMALQVGALSGLSDTVKVDARFHDAAGLQAGAQVAIAGVPVGTVSSLEIDHDVAVVHLAIDRSAGIRTDAVAQVRSRSVLGEKYVEVSPMRRDTPLASDGDVLPAGGEQTEIDEMVSALGPLVEAIDPEALATVMTALTSALEEDPDRLGRMLANADTILSNGAIASQELPSLVSGGRTTLTRVRGTLDRIDARADEAGTLIRRADGVVADVEASTGDLPALVDEIELTVEEAHTLVTALNGYTDDVGTVLENAQDINLYTLRRLLREEGILVRLRPRRALEDESDEWRRRGQVE